MLKMNARFTRILVVGVVVVISLYLLLTFIRRDNLNSVSGKNILVQLSIDKEFGYNFVRKGNVSLDMISLLPSQSVPGPKVKPVGKMMDMKIDETGQLFLKAYKSENSVFTLGGIISDFKSASSANLESQPSRGTINPSPFLFDVTSKGVITNFKFRPALGEEEKLHIKSIIYEFQFVLPAIAASNWHATQNDVMGEFNADYSVGGYDKNRGVTEITRQITKYNTNELAKSNFSPTATASKIDIIKDSGSSELSSSGMWLTKVNHKQEAKIVSNKKLIGKSDSSFEAIQTDAPKADVLPATMELLFQSMASWSKMLAEQALKELDPEFTATAEGMKWSDAVNFFLKNISGQNYIEKQKAEKFLVNYFRLHPKEIANLISYIDNRLKNNLDIDKELALWNVIALAGTHEAQEAIVGAIKNSNLSMQTRTTAINHIFNLEAPDPFVVDELWRIYQYSSASNSDSHIRNTSLFALGAIAGNNMISDSTRTSLISQLSTKLANSASERETALVLMAIGNSKRPEFLNELQQYLKNPDSSVRTEAYEALSHINSDKTVSIISSNYKDESSLLVKQRILNSINNMNVPEQISPFYQELANTETNNKLLLPIASYLATNAKASTDNIKALNTIISNKPSGQVLQEIYRHVSPDALKGKK